LSTNKTNQPEQSVSLLDWTVFQERGLEKIKNGDLEGAVVDFTQAIKNGPKNNALYYMRGTTLAKLKKYRLAIRDLKSILKDEPNNEMVKFVLKQCQASLPAKDSRHT
jgi:predicted Zn-dependent protease